MNKRKMKKMMAAVAMTLLFSSTVVYGAAGSFSWTLNPTQTVYTSAQTKSNSSYYATVTQTSTASVTEFTVVDSSNNAISGKATVSGAKSASVRYYQTVENNLLYKSVKLKAYNNPANNNGGSRTVTGTWTP